MSRGSDSRPAGGGGRPSGSRCRRPRKTAWSGIPSCLWPLHHFLNATYQPHLLLPGRVRLPHLRPLSPVAPLSSREESSHCDSPISRAPSALCGPPGSERACPTVGMNRPIRAGSKKGGVWSAETPVSGRSRSMVDRRTKGREGQDGVLHLRSTHAPGVPFAEFVTGNECAGTGKCLQLPARDDRFGGCVAGAMLIPRLEAEGHCRTDSARHRRTYP